MTIKERFEKWFNKGDRFVELYTIDEIEGVKKDFWDFFSKEIDSLLDKIEVMIAEEMNIATLTGETTSRLTSLANKIEGLKNSEKVETPEECPVCEGSGFDDEIEHKGLCPTCHGTGKSNTERSK